MPLVRFDPSIVTDKQSCIPSQIVDCPVILSHPDDHAQPTVLDRSVDNVFRVSQLVFVELEI